MTCTNKDKQHILDHHLEKTLVDYFQPLFQPQADKHPSLVKKPSLRYSTTPDFHQHQSWKQQPDDLALLLFLVKSMHVIHDSFFSKKERNNSSENIVLRRMRRLKPVQMAVVTWQLLNHVLAESEQLRRSYISMDASLVSDTLNCCLAVTKSTRLRRWWLRRGLRREEVSTSITIDHWYIRCFELQKIQGIHTRRAELCNWHSDRVLQSCVSILLTALQTGSGHTLA